MVQLFSHKVGITPVLTAVLSSVVLSASAVADDRHGRMDFQGRYIVSASDADMVASAPYPDGDHSAES